MASNKRRWTRTVTITRPANTDQYVVLDGVSTTAGAILTFAGVAPVAAGSGTITGIYIHKTDQDTTGAAFDLNLFDTTVAVAGFNDGAESAVTDAEWQTGVGFIEILAADWRNVVTGNIYCKTNLNLGYQCAATDNSLYGFLMARGTYTPASAEVFTIRLTGEVN